MWLRVYPGIAFVAKSGLSILPGSPGMLGIRSTRSVSTFSGRNGIKELSRAFVLVCVLLIIRIQLFYENVFSAEAMPFPVYIYHCRGRKRRLAENGISPEVNLCWCKLNILD